MAGMETALWVRDLANALPGSLDTGSGRLEDRAAAEADDSPSPYSVA